MFKNLTKDELNDLNSIKLYNGFKNIQIQSGWTNKVKELGLKIEKVCKEEKIDLPELMQIKSKFGTLRFYYKDNFNNERLKKLISDYHNILNNTCEICGSENDVKTMINGRIVITVCEKHNSNEYKSFEELTNWRKEND